MPRIVLVICLTVLAAVSTPLNGRAAPLDDVVAAVERGDLEALAALKAKGAPLDGRAANGYTPLFKAIIDCKADAALWLVENGADVNGISGSTWSPLTWLAYRMDRGWYPHLWPVMQAMLARGADPNLRPSPADGDMNTALMFLATEGHLEAVKLLVAKGADKTLKNWRDETATMIARKYGFEDIALFLEGKDASDYLSSLHYAVKKNDVDKVKALIAAKADVNAIEMTSRRSALYYAAQLGYLEVARLLLDAGANPDFQDRTGHTALMQAANYGFEEVALLLLERGANPKLRTIDDKNALCWQGNTSVLEFALVRRHTAVVKLAIAKGVPVDGADEFWVPLFYVSMSTCQPADVEHVKLLLAAGARPKPKFIERMTKFAEEDPLAKEILELVKPYAR